MTYNRQFVNNLDKPTGKPGGHRSHSVFEQAVERLARVTGTCRAGAGGSLLFHPHADRIKLALVAGVFPCDSFRHWLRAFEPLRGIEVRALLAGMQFESALCALA